MNEYTVIIKYKTKAFKELCSLPFTMGRAGSKYLSLRILAPVTEPITSKTPRRSLCRWILKAQCKAQLV